MSLFQVASGRADPAAIADAWTRLLRRFDEAHQTQGGGHHDDALVEHVKPPSKDVSPIHARALGYLRRLNQQASVLGFATVVDNDNNAEETSTTPPRRAQSIELDRRFASWPLYQVVECGERGLRVWATRDGKERASPETSLKVGDAFRMHPDDDTTGLDAEALFKADDVFGRVAVATDEAVVEGYVRRVRRVFDYDGPTGSDACRFLVEPLTDAERPKKKTPRDQEPYEVKAARLETALAKLRIPWSRGHVELGPFRREESFGDALLRLTKELSDAEFRQEWVFRIDGEKAKDDGGVANEVWTLAIADLFSAGRGLFRLADADQTTAQIKPPKTRGSNEESKATYFGVGRLVAKALLDRRVLSAHLARPLLCHLLSRPVHLSDLAYVDAPLHHSIAWMLEHQGADALCLTFEHKDRDADFSFELVPNGADIAVTDANKDEFVARLFKYAMLDQIARPLNAFLKGFYSVVPLDVIKDLNLTPGDLELAISGLDVVDVNDWKKHTKLSGGLYPSAPIVKLFWEYVANLTDARRAKLLQFATGTTRLPAAGFADLRGRDGPKRFELRGVPLRRTTTCTSGADDDDASSKEDQGALCLPAAHCCFNTVDLPKYESADQLKDAFDSILDTDVAFFTTA